MHICAPRCQVQRVRKRTHSYFHTRYQVLQYELVPAWKYEMVPAWDSSSGLNLPLIWQLDHVSPLTSPNSKRFGRGQRWREGKIRGLHSRAHGRNRSFFGGVRGTNLNVHTREVRTLLLRKATLWANILWMFSQAPARRRPLDTETLRGFSPNSAPHYKKGGNKERGRRLQVVELLTALI